MSKDKEQLKPCDVKIRSAFERCGITLTDAQMSELEHALLYVNHRIMPIQGYCKEDNSTLIELLTKHTDGWSKTIDNIPYSLITPKQLLTIVREFRELTRTPSVIDKVREWAKSNTFSPTGPFLSNCLSLIDLEIFLNTLETPPNKGEQP